MVFDTDVLISAMLGSDAARRVVDAEDELAISVVSYMELLRGARNKQHAREIKVLVSAMQFEILPLSGNIGHRAAIYIEEHGLGSGLDIPDALIAATAVENNLRLCTANHRHYRVIPELDIRPFRG
ncbi:MAG: type II toxin-antitoxin system VapC family toxin [Armatimonadota bacterium]